MPFLSLLDDRAKTKGSRDPLGFEAVWSQFGRRLVGNLTTITSSLENFAVALTGFAIANRTTTQHNKVVHTFLRYEQLAAYLRYSRGERRILGINRVGANWQNPPISLGLKAQILSNQASYGLWGLYASALAATGLVRGEMRIPTYLGEECCKHFFTVNDAVWRRIEDIVLHQPTVRQKEVQELAPQFIEAITATAGKTALAGHLLGGQKAPALQRELHALIPSYWKEAGTDPISAANFIAWLVDNGATREMRETAKEIGQIEKVLSSGRKIFEYLISQHGEPVKHVLEPMRQLYGREELALVVPEGKFPRRNHLLRYATALNRGAHREAIVAIMELNAEVMASRAGAPWVEARNEILQVRMQAAKAKLPRTTTELTAWENSYFIPSFLQIFRGAAKVDGEAP